MNSMKIKSVQAFLMSYPMPEKISLPFWGGVRTIIKRDAMLIRVAADNGLVGYAPGPAFPRAQEKINSSIREFLIGKDPLKWRDFAFSGSLETLKIYHAAEVALLDLVGKYEKCSISELMGGRVRNEIKLYGSAGMYMPPEKYAEEAAAIQGMGFSAYKMRPGLGSEADLKTVELMRRATGSDFKLMVDAHTWWRMGDKNYSEKEIVDLAYAFQAYNPYWLEEPLPPHDHRAYKNLKDSGAVPVATGEHEQDLDGFKDLAQMDAANFLQMDVCCQGGFDMGLKVIDLASKHGIKFAFHCWGTTLEVLAAAQLGICRSESVVEWLEYPCYSSSDKPGMYPFPLSDEILTEPLPISKGILTVPESPGLGIAIDESVVEKYPFIPGPWSFFHQDSPKRTIAVTGDHSLTWVDNSTTQRQ